MSSGPRLRLGDLLLAEGVITSAQLDEALDYQKQNGAALGSALKDLGFVSDERISEALAAQLGMEPVDLPNLDIPEEVIGKIEPMVAEVYRVIPIRFDTGANALTVAMADPLNVHALDDLRFMLNLNTIRGAVSNDKDVNEALKKYYNAGDTESIDDIIKRMETESEEMDLPEDEDTMDLAALEEMANLAPVVKLLNLILLTAIKDQASDIHFEPFENLFKIRYRIDGALLEMRNPPRILALAIISRIKVLAHLNIAERRVPQDGRIPLTIGEKAVDLRVSTLPTMFGESVVIRVLDKTVVALDINRLGMREEDLEQFHDLINKPNGILLVTGPTGSGKTTTLYACLNAVNDISEKIITTEDPVEYELPGIIQVPIRADIGVTYAKCLRAILRQDPDKILVGEIRDVETAGIAIEASLTGHLVFSTLHTQDAPGTMARLVEMGIEPFLLAATIEAIIAQRLVRCICLKCKEPYTPTEEEIYELGMAPREVEGRTFYFGRGCELCKNVGYRGRNALYEIMHMNSALRDAVIAKKSTEVLRQLAREHGMHNLRDAGLLKVFDGITTIEEVVRETMTMD